MPYCALDLLSLPEESFFNGASLWDRPVAFRSILPVLTFVSDKSNWGNHIQGTIVNLPSEDAETVLRLTFLKYSSPVETENQSPTSGMAYLRVRLKQREFRSAVLKYWHNKCAVTGLEGAHYLTTSHIHPWGTASESDRIHPFNGLALNPNLNLLFDRGLISFDSVTGQIIISMLIEEKDQQLLGINSSLKLSKIEHGHAKYLYYHRAEVFVKP